MPQLDDVTQRFEADTAPYVEALKAATDAAYAFAVANEVAAESVKRLQDAMNGMEATSALFANVFASSVAAERGMNQVADAALLSAAAVEMLTGAMTGLGGGAGGGGGGGGGWLATSIAWWRQWQAVIHWAVMGTMEILSTAIPALVAFGAAIIAMGPAFTSLKDHFTNLVTAAGSLQGAVASMPGPMGALASSMGRLSLAVAPDVWMMLGSAISIVTMHTGVFAGIARQASQVLGDFAAKIVTDLQGPAGKAMQDFFKNGVQFMTQWGQVLGQFGHAFLNVFHAMPGIGHVVLDMLDAISRTLLAITNVPFVGAMLGVIAALSGIYRYAMLARGALMFMWAAFGGQAIAGAISSFAQLSSAMGGVGAAATWVARSALVTLAGSMGLIVPVVGAAVAGLEIWYLNSQNVTEATKNLIAQVQSLPNTVQNLALGSLALSEGMHAAALRTDEFARAAQVVQGTKISAGAAAATKELNNDTLALSGALVTEYNRLKQVQTGLQSLGSTSGQVAANMAVLSIQTSMQDSKVQQLNQAWDQYLQLLTGGMSSLANYTTALSNITSVTATSGIANLSRDTGTLTLTAAQFAQQLQSGAVTGAAAWQNFTQVMTGSMGPIANYLRQAQVAGVITKTQFAQGILQATAAMIPYTGTTGTAARMLQAYAQQAGLGTVDLAALAAQYPTSDAALQDLNKTMVQAAVDMSNASAVAQNMSAVFNQQVTQALVAAALKASGFNTDVQNMMQAQQTGMDVNGHDWQYWANQAAAAWNQAVTAATTGTSQILAEQNSIPNLTTKVLQMVTVYSSINQAPGQGMARAPTGRHGLVVGMQGGGMVGGYGGADHNLVALTLGEGVLTAAAVAALGGPLGVHSLNNQPSQAVLTSGLGGGGAAVIQLTLNNTTTLDGQALSRQTRIMQLTYDRRNPTPNLSLNRPGRPG